MPKFSSEKELCGFLDSLDEEAGNAKGKNDLDRRFKDSLNQIAGKQWKGDRSPYFLYNVLGSALEDKTGKLSETKPKLNILPAKEGLEGPVDVLTNCVSSIWDRRKIEYATERIAYYGCAAGAAFVATPYNKNLDNGLGDVDFVIKDPRCCGADPSVTAPEKTDNGEYVIMEDFFPLDMVRNEYPGRGALVEANEKIAGLESTMEPKSAAQTLSGVFRRLFGGKDGKIKSAIPRTVLTEYFIKDRRKSIEDDGPVPITETTTKWNEGGDPFPGGRRIIRAGEIILEDSWNPYWDGAPPLDMCSWKIDLETIWGPDEVEGVRRMQEAVNRLGDAYTKNTILNSVVRVVMDYGALSPDEQAKISNEAGQILEKAPGRTLEYNVPPVLPVDVINFTNQLIDWIRQKLGVTIPPTQKNIPSIVTGPAIEGLQLMVETPIRTAARRIEEFYQRIGQKLVSRVIQFYTADRVLHLVAPDGKWIDFEYKRYQLLVKKDGTPRSESELRKYFQDFYFAIEPMSSLAITQTQKAMLRFQLMTAGLVPGEDVLEAVGYRNPKEKMKQAMAARASGAIPNPTDSKNSGSNSQSMGQNGLVQ